MKIIIQRLIVNSVSTADLVAGLDRIKQAISEGEREGFVPKCKWWLEDLEVDD